MTWLFGHLDTLCHVHPDGVLFAQLIAPTSAAPDRASSAEGSRHLKVLMPRVRRMVTTPLGDAMWLMLVRTIMRGFFLLSGSGDKHFVASNVDEAIAKLAEKATANTPSRVEVKQDLAALFKALDATPPWVAGAASAPP